MKNVAASLPVPVPVTAVWVDHELTRINPEYAISTPPDATSGGLGELLNRLDGFVAYPAATVMLDGTVPSQLGFSGPPPGPGKVGTEPLRRAKEQGWTITEERVWMTARRTERGKERVIHIGIVPWLSSQTFALYAMADPLLMQWRMYEWTRMLGVPFVGEQVGMSGHNVIRDRCTLKTTPRWFLPKPMTDGQGPWRETTELPYSWKGPQPDFGWIHQFDATAQHMAAMNNVYVAGDLLRREKPGEPVRKNLPGYYLVEVPHWALSGCLPHPIGRLRGEPGSPKWVTHVTLDFIMELHEDYGIVDPPKLRDSWVSDYRCRAFRTFGEILSNALRESATYEEDPVMRESLKTLYKATVGMMARPGGRIHRPDWTHAVIAQARCDLWRKAWREGSKARYQPPRSDDVLVGTGAWPVRMETDALWYASPTDAPNWPATFLRGDGLTPGTFVVKKSQKVGE